VFYLFIFYVQLKQIKITIKCETKSTKTKRNQRNETKPTKAKRNELKQNEIDWYEENGRKKIKIIVFKKSKYHFFLFLYFVLSYFFPSIFFISVYFVLLSLVSFIKFLEWAYRKKWGKWGGIFIDWDIEGSLFVWFYYVFRLYST
jgi:hypothetical protein